MKNILRILLLLAVGVVRVYSSVPAAPYVYVVTNSASSHLFVMLTDDATHGRFGPAGKCYKIGADGKFVEIWNVSGWYSYPGSVYLSGSGEVLARVMCINHPVSDVGKMESLVFYKHGSPLKTFLVKDIINPEKVRVSPFLDEYEIVNYYSEFAPVMIEGSKVPDNKRTPNVLRAIERRGADSQFFLIRNRELEWLIFDMIDGSLIDRGLELDEKKN